MGFLGRGFLTVGGSPRRAQSRKLCRSPWAIKGRRTMGAGGGPSEPPPQGCKQTPGGERGKINTLSPQIWGSAPPKLGQRDPRPKFWKGQKPPPNPPQNGSRIPPEKIVVRNRKIWGSDSPKIGSRTPPPQKLGFRTPKMGQRTPKNGVRPLWGRGRGHSLTPNGFWGNFRDPGEFSGGSRRRFWGSSGDFFGGVSGGFGVSGGPGGFRGSRGRFWGGFGRSQEVLEGILGVPELILGVPDQFLG